MQTVLGAGDTIGVELARILPDHAERVRLVSRTPAKLVPSNEVFAADLTDAAQATAMLGNPVDAFGEVWHLPTAPPPMAGREWVNAHVLRFLGRMAERYTAARATGEVGVRV